MIKNNHCAIINVISDLQARGFTLDFSVIRSKLFCAQEQCYLEPEEFATVEMYRYQSSSRSHNLTDVYAIESLTRPLKGILLINATLVCRSMPIDKLDESVGESISYHL